MTETATSPELVMQEFFTRVFGAAIADSLIGKQVQVSFDPAGYDQWLSNYGRCNLGTHHLEVTRRPHCSVGIVSSFDYYQTPDPVLILVTTIASIGGIKIDSIQWYREVNSRDEGRWTAHFKTMYFGGWQEQTVPILLKILD